MKQTYFKEPKYSKNYIIQKPRNLYEEYVNAFAFCEMINTKNEVPNKKELQERAQNSWQEVKMRSKDFIQNHIFELLQTPVQPVQPRYLTFFSQQTSVKNPPKPPSEPLEVPKVSEPRSPYLLTILRKMQQYKGSCMKIFKKIKPFCTNTIIY